MIRYLRQFCFSAHYLSLDIIAGALAVSYYYSRLLDIVLPWIYWPALAITVWLIYLADHLADSIFLYTPDRSPALSLFEKNRSFIVLLILFLLILLILILFWAPITMILFGLVGGLFVLAYLIVNQVQNRSGILFFPRELIISIFYVFGTCGYQIILSDNLTIKEILYCVGIYLLTLTNVLIYSFFEYSKDRTAGVKSLAVVISEKMTYKTAIIAAVLAGLLFIILLITGTEPFYFSITGLIMSLILMSILFFRKFNAQKKSYGLIADFTFLLPWFTALF